MSHSTCGRYAAKSGCVSHVWRNCPALCLIPVSASMVANPWRTAASRSIGGNLGGGAGQRRKFYARRVCQQGTRSLLCGCQAVLLGERVVRVQYRPEPEQRVVEVGLQDVAEQPALYVVGLHPAETREPLVDESPADRLVHPCVEEQFGPRSQVAAVWCGGRRISTRDDRFERALDTAADDGRLT